MDADSNRPIIIKRKKVISGGGHHGGAWKVAYADFVTAMMAFFMLMWLLNATTEVQRKGIADYFTPTIPINRISGGGSGALNGDSVFTSESLSQSGRGGVAADDTGKTADQAAVDAAKELAALEDIQGDLLGLGGESALLDNALRHVVTRLTDEGLVIELFDLPDAPLFFGETDTPEPMTIELIKVIAKLFTRVENKVTISSHVRTKSVLRVDNPVWHSSIGRASRTRLLLESGGLQPERIVKLSGEGDRAPVTTDPTEVRNNRLEIVIQRSDQSLGR